MTGHLFWKVTILGGLYRGVNVPLYTQKFNATWYISWIPHACNRLAYSSALGGSHPHFKASFRPPAFSQKHILVTFDISFKFVPHQWFIFYWNKIEIVKKDWKNEVQWIVLLF